MVPAGQIERDVVIQLLTQPGTATSELIIEIVGKGCQLCWFVSGGDDYEPGPYSVTFTVGSTRQCTEIDINDDDTPEDDETFIVTIPPSTDVIPPDPTIVTIVDDGIANFTRGSFSLSIFTF